MLRGICVPTRPFRPIALFLANCAYPSPPALIMKFLALLLLALVACARQVGSRWCIRARGARLVPWGACGVGGVGRRLP